MLKEYQQFTRTTKTYRESDRLAYNVIGLAGEAGEVANEYKKALREDNGVITKERLEKIVLEMGDVLWYVTALGAELGVGLEEIITLNVRKLAERKKVDVPPIFQNGY